MKFNEILVFAMPQTGSWLVDIIAWLIKISTSIALGVILFTLLLKLITLPFDFISRANMRKNSLKMEEMRPELEKLQKQYANDKALYNQKMMALYKKNGYSMWGACLPTILTLVIFIVAINAFTKYSQYENKMYLYNMTNAHNNVVYSGVEVDDNYIVKNSDGSLSYKLEDLIALDNQEGDKNLEENKIQVQAGNHDIFCEVSTENNTQKTIVYTTNSYFKYVKGAIVSYELVDDFSDKLTASDLRLDSKTFAQYLAEQDLTETTEKQVAEKFILEIRETKAAESFRKEKTSFLWVKNLWVTDSPLKHPIDSDWNNFKKTNIGDDATITLTNDGYKSLISKLHEEKTQPNGYFILVALTALSSLLMQWITSKSQKAQMELQTVDGQGAQTNKMMMWMMPIMMAVFAFMYTAAFSIYIVISSVFSILTTFLINAIIDKKYKKVESSSSKQVVRGRVYIPPKEEPKPQPKQKKVKEPEVGDFLTGKVKRKK